MAGPVDTAWRVAGSAKAAAVGAVVLVAAVALFDPRVHLARNMSCSVTADARLDELQAAGLDALDTFLHPGDGSSGVQVARISDCSAVPDVAVRFTAHDTDPLPVSWREAPHDALIAAGWARNRGTDARGDSGHYTSPDGQLEARILRSGNATPTGPEFQVVMWKAGHQDYYSYD